MRRLYLIAFIVIVGLLVQSCSDNSTAPNSKTDPPGPAPGEIGAADKALIESTNRFGFRLFREINAAEDPDINIFVSPLSVSFALGMCYNGANGDTREAIASTLEMSDLSPEEINQSYRDVIDLLTHLDPHVKFRIANSIWPRTGFPISPEFVDLNQTYFDAQVRELDFSQPWAADTINNWVDVNTNGKITEIVRPPIPPYIVLFLINAIYFNGNWTIPFDTSLTTDMPFMLNDGTTEMRPMMITDTTLVYGENDFIRAVDLPYGDKSFSMALLLPEPEYTVDDIIEMIDPETWNDWRKGFSEVEKELHLPRFRFEYGIELKRALAALGMGLAFDKFAADFSNMVTDMAGLQGNLYIDRVCHKAFVQVDESGTEAAAVTGISFGVTSIDPRLVAFNRPFVFVIYEHETGSILFMGKIVDPVWR